MGEGVNQWKLYDRWTRVHGHATTNCDV